MREKFQKYIDRYPKGAIHFLVPGHGGVGKDGVYNILKKGSKQAVVNGKHIYEGAINRNIRDAILMQRPKSMHMVNVINTVKDTPLAGRVLLCNKLHNVYTKAGWFPIIWELHCNAFNGKVSGTEVYTTRKDNLSDAIATAWNYKAFKIIDKYTAGNWNWRSDYSDGDVDKEADFYLLRKARSFGVLIEFFFFDNPHDLNVFNHEAGYKILAQTVVDTAKKINSLWEK